MMPKYIKLSDKAALANLFKRTNTIIRPSEFEQAFEDRAAEDTQAKLRLKALEADDAAKKKMLLDASKDASNGLTHPG